MKRILLISMLVALTITACGAAKELIPVITGSTSSAVVPPGAPLAYQWGELRVVSFHRPTAFQVVRADLVSGITDKRPSRPATGAEFVSVELAFSCAAAETKCEEPPQAYLSLELADGRIVQEGFVPMTIPWMGNEAVVGSGGVEGWITFEIPKGAEVAALLVEPYEAGNMLKAALPASQDGYARQMPWQEYDDGSADRELTTLRRDMEQTGFEMIWAGYYRAGGETGLYVTVYTDELFFFEEGDAVAEARQALFAAADLWPDYSEGADYLGVEMWNDLSGETVALVGADAADLADYTGGKIDADSFVARWWVVDSD